MGDVVGKIVDVEAGEAVYSKIELEKDFEKTEMLAKGVILLFFFGTGGVSVEISV